MLGPAEWRYVSRYQQIWPLSDLLDHLGQTILTAMPAKLAPRLVGRLEPDIERIIREEVVDSLTQLSGKPWTTNPPPNPTESEKS